MTAIASLELIAELDQVVTTGSPERRAQILRRITGVFLSGAARLGEEHVELFDDIFVRLMDCIDAPTLAAFSAMLSKQTSTPRHTVRRLAFDGDATVAGPVLLKSSALAEADLAEIAGSRGQAHLLAIAGRKRLGEALTDILLARGDSNVCREVVNNAGARFSRRGLALLFAAAERDDDISDLLVVRPDVPVDLVYQLVAKSTKVVQARLLKIASAQLRETVRAAGRSCTNQFQKARSDRLFAGKIHRSGAQQGRKAQRLQGQSLCNPRRVQQCSGGAVAACVRPDRDHRAVDGRKRLLRARSCLSGVPA